MYKLSYVTTGSQGNCCLIETDDVKFLIDLGIPPSPFKRQIKDFSSISTLDFVLITHEHGDHIFGAKKIIDKYKIPCYLSKGTYENSDFKDLNNYLVNIMTPNKKYTIEGLTILPFKVDHDAEEPLGFLIKNKVGEKLLFVADCGNFDFEVDADIYAVELNYMEEVVENVEVEEAFKYKRVQGQYGHAGMEKTIEFAKSNPDKEYIFHHLSRRSVDMGRLIERLDAEKIKYRIADNGKSFKFDSVQ
jgi:phosphoribosyl 1,2-cyclic phosphodiesterase